MKTHFRDSIRRGFTLMELMVAMAITTIIVTVLVSITSVSIEAWQKSRSEIRASRQGKAMTDSMAADFQAMVTRKGNSFEWLYADLSKDSDLPGNAKVKSNNAASLIFFSAPTDRYSNVTDQGGDVSCISYKLDYKDPVSGQASTSYDTFAMYRLLVEPNETFNSLLGQTDLQTAFGTRTVSDVKNFVCENVYQFTLKFNVEVQKASTSPNTPPTKQIVPVTLTRGPSSSGGGGGASGTTVTTAQSVQIFGNTLKVLDSNNTDFKTSLVTVDEMKAGRIVSVDISLTVLTDVGTNQLRVRTFKDDKEKAQFIAKNSYQFSKLVEVTSM
ncbi:prepilin-type N-terminal cleavage/methylation domain-containing protein [Luteolibacter ambystomatis]|uniref:Prepilin-type N-terminal cleavage/methylation domain-containing protein n=1 Tax=Luteolibacter ambystomatis TaxID=2824561 RepID=A0A975G611_9BACT|nr:prepilin-type N-terminal cleavage/methylation domain-containing protein [Luteolibacter ambystomatis]QUE49406.1 prepilin-type N-terminal cleavage/methylation domain-containing protein [Luteolibacter ambystomatis]